VADVFPFSAVHYNPEKFPDLSSVITPPYDVIADNEVHRLLERSAYNFAHLDLPRRDPDDYAEQKKAFDQWREEQVVVKDGAPAFYFYRQIYDWNGTIYTRDALVAAVQLHEFSERVVLPHENTHGKAKTDRLNLMRAFQCQLSHIFGVVKDDEKFLAKTLKTTTATKPLLKGRSEDGVDHTLWIIPNEFNTSITDFFRKEPIYIVDGHHRYESSVTYAKEVGAFKDPSLPASAAVFSICTTSDPGLIVLPTHRIVRGVANWDTLWAKANEAFHITPMTALELEAFTEKPTEQPCFAVAWKDKLFLVQPKDWKSSEKLFGYALHKLSVHWSDRIFLRDVAGIPDTAFARHLTYEREFGKAFAAIKDSSFVVFQPQPEISDMTDIADEGKFMPPKSTYFYPKLASGLLLRDLQ
jgi:uncharacterized protein (DUF1015 family)